MNCQRSEKRLVIIDNPISTGASHVQREVFDRLDSHGVIYTRISTQSPDMTANTHNIAEQLQDGDRVISAAGDGTASQIANAMLLSGVDTELGVLPYGNFNDTAYSHMKRTDTVLDLLDADSIDATLLTIEIDGDHWRDELAYVTMGWTALAASEFAHAASRKDMRGTPRAMKLGRNLVQLAGNYFQHRTHYLPAFSTNHSPLVHQAVTDILAINSPRVGSIVRSKQPYYDSPHFGYREVDVSHIIPNIPFGIQAITGYTPLSSTNRIDITFPDGASDIPIQHSGEFAWIGANTISIYKDPLRTIKILHTQ